MNAFIRTGGLFDAVADFDAATIDPQTGALPQRLRAEQHDWRRGDRLHRIARVIKRWDRPST